MAETKTVEQENPGVARRPTICSTTPERIWIIPDQFWQFWYTMDMKGESVEYVRADLVKEKAPNILSI